MRLAVPSGFLNTEISEPVPQSRSPSSRHDLQQPTPVSRDVLPAWVLPGLRENV